MEIHAFYCDLAVGCVAQIPPSASPARY